MNYRVLVIKLLSAILRIVMDIKIDIRHSQYMFPQENELLNESNKFVNEFDSTI